MINNGQFFSSFVFTLCVFGVIAAFLGIALAIGPVRRFLLPFRERLWRSRTVCFIRAAGAILGIVRARIMGFTKGRLSIFVVFLRRVSVSLWQIFIAFLAAFGRWFQKVPNWIPGASVAVFMIGAMSCLSLVSAGVPWSSIVGVAAAGCLAGVFFVSFVNAFCYWPLRPGRVIGVSLLTITGGAWFSVVVVAMIAVAATG